MKKNQQRGQLLILDRTHDLISPIIHELYYQAMIADIIRPPQDVYKYTILSFLQFLLS